MKVCIFTVSLNTKITGIDKFAVGLANELVKRGHQVVYVSHPGDHRYGLESLNRSIKKFNIAQNYSDQTVSALRNFLVRERVDVALPMISNSIVSIFVPALRGTGIPLLVSEHNNPDHYLGLWWKLGRGLEQKRKTRTLVMSAADRIHLLNEGFKNSLPEFLHERIRIIKNPADGVFCDQGVPSLASRGKFVLYVGRLDEPQKQVSVLIEAFAKVLPAAPGWRLRVVGDGPDKKKYQDLAHDLGVAGAILFEGEISNPELYYRDSQVFCLASKFEGCPLTLIEAKFFGLPVVGFSSCSGVNEMIETGRDGILCDDGVDALADALRKMVLDRDYRILLSGNSLLSAEDYRDSHIYDKWESLLFDAAKCKGNTVLSSLEVPSYEEEIKYELAKISTENVFWTYMDGGVSPKRHKDLEASYKVLVGSLSWKVTWPLRAVKSLLRIFLSSGREEAVSLVKEFFSTRVLRNSSVIKKIASILPGHEVVFIDVPNMDDNRKIFGEFFDESVFLKNIPYGFLNELKIARANCVVSSCGAVKREYVKSTARRIEVWHASGAVKGFSNRSYRNVTGEYTICAPSEYVRSYYSTAFGADMGRVAPVGCPKTDIYFQETILEDKKKKFYEENPTLLGKRVYVYAPTFRGKWPDKVSLNLELDIQELAGKLNDDEVFLFKLHPVLMLDISGNKVWKSNLKVVGSKILDYSSYDIETLLYVADVVIVDYSSVVFDAVLLNKPMVAYAEDVDQYAYEQGLAFEYREEMPCPIVEVPSVEELMGALRNGALSESGYREFKAKYLDACDGNAARRVMSMIKASERFL